MSRPRVFLGLGSNVGDREETIARAVASLERRGFQVTAQSSLYETEPMDAPPQAWFLNAVVLGETALSPEALLEACLATERDLGRVRRERSGPRTLDIDLLLYADEVRHGPALTLPHPRLHERLFVLVPLVELDPASWHPGLGLSAAELKSRCADCSRVVLYGQPTPRH